MTGTVHNSRKSECAFTAYMMHAKLTSVILAIYSFHESVIKTTVTFI